MVTQKIEAIQQKRPGTPPIERPPASALDPTFPRTPRSVTEVVNHEVNIQWYLNDGWLHEDLERPLNQFIKGAIASAHARGIAENELREVHRHATEKGARKSLAGNVAQKGGVITINDIRQGIKMGEDSELIKAQNAANRANATLLRHQLTVSKQLGVAIKKLYMIGKKEMTKAEQQEAIRVISRHIAGCVI